MNFKLSQEETQQFIKNFNRDIAVNYQILRKKTESLFTETKDFVIKGADK